MPVTSTAVPISPGTVAHFAASAAPAGWIKANGAAVSRTAYAALFQAIGTTYGAGDGSTTFNVPDLRGEFLRSLDDGRGVDSGRGIGTAQSFAQQNITGSFDGPYNTGAFSTNATGVFSQTAVITGTVGLSAAGTAPRVNLNASGQIQTAAEVRPRNVSLLACIKF